MSSNDVTSKQNNLQLIYLQFNSLSCLKKFTEKFPIKKVFIMLNQKILLANLSDKEIDLAVEKFEAEVINAVMAWSPVLTWP